MTRSAVEETTHSRRRFLITWLLLLGLTLAAFAGTVAVLNSTLYSASGFVGSYLNALARHDVSAALATPGVTPPASGRMTSLSLPRSARLATSASRRDTVGSDGAHRVGYSYSFAGKRMLSQFVVVRAGVHLGFFSSWRFQVSPMGVLTVTAATRGVLHGERHPADRGEARSAGRVPGAHPGLGGARAFVDVLCRKAHPRRRDPAGSVAAEVDIQANDAFVSELQKQLDAQLKQCTTQKVLLPTGCPFGQHMDNRIEGDPIWSMATLPEAGRRARTDHRRVAGADDAGRGTPHGQGAVTVRRHPVHLRRGRAVHDQLLDHVFRQRRSDITARQ